jgi:hypothetical protein
LHFEGTKIKPSKVTNNLMFIQCLRSTFIQTAVFGLFLVGAPSYAGVAGEEFNPPNPALQAQVEGIRQRITDDTTVQRLLKSDLATKALYIQILNQLRHVSLTFSMRDRSYTHDYVLKGAFPQRPTEITLKKANEFLAFVHAPSVGAEGAIPPDPARAKQLMAEQKALVKKITNEPVATYLDMRRRLQRAGPEASFPEFASLVEYLTLHLRSDAAVLRLSTENSVISNFRALALREFGDVTAKGYPYLSTIEAVQRTVEFLDVLQRSNDPSRSPKLYHSDRYEYYGHFLKGEIPDHIFMPTIASLGATDILRARCVPIGLVGVNTDITWVDGFYQTPYEFWLHDVNHTRRMWQFFKEAAARKGMNVEDFARQSEGFFRTKLLPLIAISPADSYEIKNQKRLMKILLFEILHEDALAADADVVINAVLRPPNLITPFEEMNGLHVTYVMEPGATTLAYAYRKLAHDFYDMPGERIDNIVAEEFRTRENIVAAAEILGKALGVQFRKEVLEYFATTDLGFPKDFKQTLIKDIAARPGATVPLDQVGGSRDHDVIELTAEAFHSTWQKTTGYFERWKISQAVFKDGTGINDGKMIDTPSKLDAYLADRDIPDGLRQYFSLRADPRTGEIKLYEDIQHLPHRDLAPNNQFENISGATVAVRLIERIVERGLNFHSLNRAMDWLRAACESMQQEWLRRNQNWAGSDPLYNRPWRELRAVHQQNGVNLLKIALEMELQLNPTFLSGSQKTLFQEAFRRMELEVQQKATSETKLAMTGDRIHSDWQTRSGYTERMKVVDVKLDDGGHVDSPATLAQYFRERQIPAEYQRFFRFENRANGIVLLEDIQNLPHKYLAPKQKTENEISASEGLRIVDRIWNKALHFRTLSSAERWLRAASQSVHAGVIARNNNEAANNPLYNVSWLDLPAVNQRHDLSVVKAALKTRFELNPASLPQADRLLLLRAFESLERQIQSGGVRRDCQDVLEKATVVAP